MSKIDKNIERDYLLEQVGKRAKEIFDRSKFKTQAELRNSLENKFSDAMLSDFFAGKSNITIYNLWLILTALKGSADYVLFGKEQKPLLSDFQALLNQVRNESIDISDQDIKEIILALSEYKKTDVKKFEILKRIFTRGDKELENTVINIIELLYKKAE